MWGTTVEHKKPAALGLGKIRRWPMALACRTALVVLFITSALWPIPAHAESVPPHIVSMTKELLLATRDDFKAATGDDEQAQRVQRVYRILRREGLYNWRLTPVTRDGFVPKMAAVFGFSQIGPAETEKFIKFLEAQTGGRSDAAIDELYTALGRARATGAERKRVVDGWNALWAETWAGVALTYEMEASRGPQTISLTWDMDRARFTIRVLEEGDAATRKMQTTITGLVGFAFDRKARNLIVSVRPAQMPITSGSPDIQSATAQPRVGPPVKKKDKAADKKEVKKDKKEAKEDKKEKKKGETSPDKRTDKQEQIDAKRKRIEEIKSDKADVWENTQTKEKIRQKRFRKLKEPFEYKGKGYATDEAENEVARLEKEIATLEFGVAPVPVAEPKDENQANRLDNPAGGDGDRPPPSGGGIISLTKSIYFQDEPVVFRHRAKTKQELYVNFVDMHANFVDWNWFFNKYDMRSKSVRLDENVPEVEVWLDALPDGVAFRDFAVESGKEWSNSKRYLESKVYTRSKEYIRVVRRESRLPGALTLIGDPIRNFGKPVEVDVSIPPGRFAGPKDIANRGPKRNYVLRIVRVGRRMLGGAVTTDYEVANHRIVAPSSRIRIMSNNWESGTVLYPATYDIRLMTNGFIVAETRVVITIDELPGALRLLNPGGQPIGQPIPAIFEAPWPLPRYYKYLLEVVGITDTGRLSRLNPSPDLRFFVEPGTTLDLGSYIRRAGTYRARLLLAGRFSSRSDDRPKYILDRLDFRIVERTDVGFKFSVNGYDAFSGVRARIMQGDPVNMVLSLTGKNFLPGRIFEVALYHASKLQQEVMGPQMVEPSNGPPLKVWKFASDKPATWQIDSNREAGLYLIALTMIVDDKRIPMPSPVFWILPGAAGVVSSDAADASPAAFRFDNGRSFNVNTLPNAGFSLSGGKAPGDAKVWFNAIRIGGRVPGCAIERPPYYGTGEGDDFLFTGSQVSPTGEVVLETNGVVGPGPKALAAYVGTYLLRAGIGSKMLAESAFEIVAKADNRIKITAPPRVEFGRYFYVDVALPPDPPHSIEKIGVYLTRLGVTVTGGAESVSVSEKAREVLRVGEGVYRAKFLPREQGLYEIRVDRGCTRSRFRNDSICPIIATQQIVVRMSESPFSLNAGIGSVGLRNTMPRDDDPWPPLGDFLNGVNCKPVIKAKEEITLRIVRWVDGQFVPIDGGLDFGAPFYVEGVFKDGTTQESYMAKLTVPDGLAQDVRLFISKDDPNIVRSEMLYFIFDSEPDADDPRS